MRNKTEVLYDVIFKSIYNILNQNDIYELEFNTITTNTEIALINDLNYIFKNFTRIGCWFHLNQDIIRNARTYGLLNTKSKSIDINETNKIITELSLLPLTYKGNMENFNNIIN